MSGVFSATDVGTLNAALYNVGLTQSNINTLTAQASSNLISSEFAGLGTGARIALDLSGQLALNTAFQTNAAQAADVNQVAQTALGQIQSLVSGVSAQLLEPSSVTGSGLSTLASDARNALDQVASLLNTKVGQVFVFAGQDSRTAPVPDPANLTQSAFYTAIQTAVDAVSTSGATAVQAQVLASASAAATSPFSTSLQGSNQMSTADLGDGQAVGLSVLADQNSDAISAGTGTTSTGSYMRDVLMALSTIGALGSANSADPQVQALLGSVQTTLAGADDALNTDIGGLGTRQATITDAQTELSATATALTTQLDAAQDADPATVATKLAAANTQLQASYKIIADLAQLSLAKYL